MTNEIITKFGKIGSEIIELAEVYEFKTSDLPEINDFKTDIRIDPNFSRIFEELNLKTNNCIYWFNFESERKAAKINLLLDNNREELKDKFRVIPPPNKNENSKTLYVGIRRGGVRKRDKLTNISGRMIQHLGYYDKGSTQGLQLVHWANKANASIFLHVVELVDLPDTYLNVIEGIVAYKLKPLCGKH